MNMPPKDNRNTSKSNSRRATRKRSVLVRVVLPIAIIVVGVSLIATLGLHLINISFGSVSVQEKPISAILNMADAHTLASVTLSGNDVNATGKTGQQYHAVKEDGQSVTEIFRHDGVAVNVDSGQREQLVQGGIDILIIFLVAGAMYFFIRRSSMRGQSLPIAR